MRITLVFTLLVAIVSPAFPQLTEQTVRQIIREELEPIKLDVAEMTGKIEALEGKMATKDDLMAINKDLGTTKDDLRDMWKDIIGKIYVLYGIIIAVLIAIIGVMLTIIFAPRWIEQRNGKRLQRIEAEIEAIKEAEEKRRKAARKIAEEKPEFAEAFRMLGLL